MTAENRSISTNRRKAGWPSPLVDERILMSPDSYAPYVPLNTLKPVAESIWIADGPEISMRYLGMTMPFPTRMTVVRLASGEIWIHSPIEWSDDLASAVMALGPVSYLVAPNTLHYWHLPSWQSHFPAARSYGPPGLVAKARRPLMIDESLSETVPDAWKETFHQWLIAGSVLTEVDFFHRPSRTLILTDLIENFETCRVHKPWLRWAIRLGGAADPDGKAPFDMQVNFLGRRALVRAAIEHMIVLMPKRIIIAHGRCYDHNAIAELRRAFRWVL
ncbi:DUF4336 domain-containing protein [Labrys okinawensis]|uniref:DUF4336 domain-containing protein n=1 Tax=Labrys okinawensis TaxID=346911 RepID=UPI0039BCEE8B